MFFNKVKNSIRSRCKAFRVKQRAHWKSNRSRIVNLGHPAAVIWIFGCQRSSTTFLENIFRHDLDSVVFGEFSQLTINPGKTVLKDPLTVRDIVESQNARYAVIRPLFESDRADELMRLFPNSVGVWLFRDCPHVVDSMIRKWGNRFFEVSRKNESDDNGRWRLEQEINGIRSHIRNGGSIDPTAEAYAQYWLLRNRIPFESSLTKKNHVLFISYQQLVSDPGACINKILDRVGLIRKGLGKKADGRTSRISNPIYLNINPDTQVKCEQTYQKLLELSLVN